MNTTADHKAGFADVRGSFRAIVLLALVMFAAGSAGAEETPKGDSSADVTLHEWTRMDAELLRSARRLVELGREKQELTDEMRGARADYNPGDIGPASVLARRRIGRLAGRMEGLAREQGGERESFGRILRTVHENRERIEAMLIERRGQRGSVGPDATDAVRAEAIRIDAWLTGLSDRREDAHQRTPLFLNAVLGEGLAEGVAREFRPPHPKSGRPPAKGDGRGEGRGDRRRDRDEPPGSGRDGDRPDHHPPGAPPPPPPPPPREPGDPREAEEFHKHRDRSSWGSLRAELAQMRSRIERLEREQLEARETIQRQQTRIDRLNRKLRALESPGGEDSGPESEAEAEAGDPGHAAGSDAAATDPAEGG